MPAIQIECNYCGNVWRTWGNLELLGMFPECKQCKETKSFSVSRTTSDTNYYDLYKPKKKPTQYKD